MTDSEIRKIKFSQINLPVPASDKLKTLSNNFRYGKELKGGKSRRSHGLAIRYN